MGEGQIPITAILRYADHYKMSDEEKDDFIFFIRSLDAAYLNYRAEQQK